jgi:NAD(P)H-dependent FMN reductase
MPDFETPSYNQDVQNKDGFPAGADRFRECIQTNDAFVVSSPEYNASMPGLLKNTIDWVSRFSPQPFNELQERFESTTIGFMDLAEASKHYPRVKTQWVEYLGERPDPATDRVE